MVHARNVSKINEIGFGYANKYPADNAGGKTDGRAPVADGSNLIAEGYEIERVQHTGGTLSADQTTVEGNILTGENDTPVLDNDSAAVSENALSISIKNEPGVALPNTGGPGPAPLYFLGLMLMSFAGAGLIMRKRRQNAA